MIPRLLILSLLACPALLHAEPYTGWMEDYTGSEAGTLLLWKFDSGAERLDSSPGNKWVISSNTTFTKGVFGTPGKFGESYYADPASGTEVMAQSVAGGVNDVFNGAAMSVELWFAPESDTLVTGYLFDKMYNTANGMSLQLTSGGELKFQIGNGSITKTLTSSAQDWAAGEWQHVAVTYENVEDVGEAKIYLNGVVIASASYNEFGNLAAGTRRWTLGNRSGSTYFPQNGYYDNFRVSDVAYEYGVAIPEPSIALLMLPALGAGAMFLKRNRQN